MNSESSDAELIVRAQAGEREAFGQLYRRYLDSIYRYIRTRVSTNRDAEDLTELVFLSAFKSLDSYEERGAPFGAFLYRIAHNAVVDHYRKRELAEPLEDAERYADPQPGVEGAILESEELRAIQSGLNQLPEIQQEVIRLRILLGLPTEEVANWLGREASTIRVIQHRALKSLRRMLGVTDDKP